MNDLDDLLKQNLDPADSAALERDGTIRDQFAQITDSFRGKTAMLSTMWILEVLIMSALGVTCVVLMFRADELRMTVIWAAAAVACTIVVGLMKMWFYMMLNRNRVLREVKRLELGVALLSEKVRGDSGVPG